MTDRKVPSMKLRDLLIVNEISFSFSKCSRCGGLPYEEELTSSESNVEQAEAEVASNLHGFGWRINEANYITCPNCRRELGET